MTCFTLQRAQSHCKNVGTTISNPRPVRGRGCVQTHRAARTSSARHAAAQQAGVQTSADAQQQQQRFMLEDTRRFLELELPRVFETGEITSSRYSSSMRFEDPLFRVSDVAGYGGNIRLLRTLFNINYTLRWAKATADDEITTRWTMKLQPWLLPWRPQIVVTGTSTYTIDIRTGDITSQIDKWDGINDNNYLSLEAVQHVLAMLSQVAVTPDLETPDYSVLKKTKDYEVRQYAPYMVAEVNMPAGASPAAGGGFNDLAGYIFGGNDARASMEMTTPVITTAGQGGKEGGKMAFVMEKKYGTDESLLPTPKDTRVVRRVEGGGIFAARQFSGWPLDFEVVENEQRLRKALVNDGLQPMPGYRLARYNDPFTPPFVRRNEVIIPLVDFHL